MIGNKRYTTVGDALQAGGRRFESAIAHDSVVNWKSMLCVFPFHYILSASSTKGVANSGYIWVHVGIYGYILVANSVAND